MEIPERSSGAVHIGRWFCNQFSWLSPLHWRIDLYIEDTPENRKRLRNAYATYGMGDFEIFETTRFIPGWVDFPLHNGVRLDIQTSLKGVDLDFDTCYKLAPTFEIEGVKFHFLHINHLIANKKAVGRTKDKLDVEELEKIKKLREEENL